MLKLNAEQERLWNDPAFSLENMKRMMREGAAVESPFGASAPASASGAFPKSVSAVMPDPYHGQTEAAPNKWLAAWAAHQTIDPDLALLLCSSIAAHLAGPLLTFRSSTLLGGHPPPTLVGAAEDVGFHHSVMAAAESLDWIENKFMAISRGMCLAKMNEAMEYRERVDGDNAELLNPNRGLSYQMGQQLHMDATVPLRYVRKEALARTRFMLPGAFPTKPENELKSYHMGAALATGAVERLPASQRAREARVNVLSRSILGVSLQTDDRRALARDSRGSIRGILRFMGQDLEWLAQNRIDFMHQILPMGCLDGQMPVSFGNEAGYVRGFDEARRDVLRMVLDERRYLIPSKVAFRSQEVDNQFMEYRAIYQAEVRDSPQLSPAAACLPDLFAWYLLRIGTRAPNEMEIVQQAFGAARNLRRRASDFYNRCAAVKQARERLVLASRLVERMRSLDRACKRRDLVRGLNIQRMELVGPVIDSLVGIGVFMESGGMLSLCLEACAKPLREYDFMEIDGAAPHLAPDRLSETNGGSAVDEKNQLSNKA